jgi:hypothetical protein
VFTALRPFAVEDPERNFTLTRCPLPDFTTTALAAGAKSAAQAAAAIRHGFRYLTS